ncbi:MAG TPA: trimethylamine-N-oxide reductase TorA [Candidatus Acidoferrales bacterium]|nr:trimethylamine-N-oxide reductase TorA [Candidatus Acidoferrales bacterium]
MTYVDRPGPTRKEFTLGSAAALAAVAANSPIEPAEAAVTEGTPISASHFGVYTPVVEKGRLVKAIPFSADPSPNEMVEAYPSRVNAKNRVTQPAIRASVLQHGPGSHPELRGSDEFIPVSWDRALEFVAGELKRVKAKYGNRAIYGGSYGWHSAGKLHVPQTLLHRMLNLHGGYVDVLGDYSTGASQVIMPHVVGTLEVYEQQTAWPVLLENTDLIVLWGADLLKSNRIGWLPPDHYVYSALKELVASQKKRKIDVICIDPIQTETSQYLGAEWIAPRPSTDVALMLGIAHTLYTNQKHDQKFLDTYTVGFEIFADYLTGKADGQAKDADWAAKITDISADKIRDLAARFTSGKTMLMSGWAVQRQDHGEQVHWMLVTLASMLGQIGTPGGGFGLSYHYCSGGSPTSSDPGLGGISATPTVAGSGTSATPWLQHAQLAFPVASVTDMLTHPGKTIDYNGKKLTYPDVKLIYWAGGNPFHHQQQLNKLLSAWRKPETIIVQDFFWTATAKLADVVLPAAMEPERNDIDEVGDYSGRYIVAMKRAVAPGGEARTDYDIFSEISKHLGFGKAFTEGKTEMAWIESFYDAARKAGAVQHVSMPSFSDFWKRGYVEFPIPDSAKAFVRYSDFRANPSLHPVGTPSGKIEIYSPTIATYKYDDCPPHPTWLIPAEWLGSSLTEKYPLHLLSPHPKNRLHSQLDNTTLRESYEIAGREPVWIHPSDAKARGIKSGDIVRLFNGRGQVLAGAYVTNRIRPYCVALFEGAWYDPEKPGAIGSTCKHGDANVLTLDKPTSKLARGNSANTALVQIEKFAGTVPPVTAFNLPKMPAS